MEGQSNAIHEWAIPDIFSRHVQFNLHTHIHEVRKSKVLVKILVHEDTPVEVS